MTDSDAYTTARGVTIRRNQYEAFNYEVIARESGEVIARVGWLTLQPSGVPLAVGDAPAEVQLGGNESKRFEWANAHGADGATLVATGARVYLGDDA